MDNINHLLENGVPFFKIILTRAQNILMQELHEEITSLESIIAISDQHILQIDDLREKMLSAAKSYSQSNLIKDRDKGDLYRKVTEIAEQMDPKEIDIDSLVQQHKLTMRSASYPGRKGKSRSEEVGYIIEDVVGRLEEYKLALKTKLNSKKLKEKRNALETYGEQKPTKTEYASQSGVPYHVLLLDPSSLTDIEHLNTDHLLMFKKALEVYAGPGHIRRLLGDDYLDGDRMDKYQNLILEIEQTLNGRRTNATSFKQTDMNL